MDTVMDRLLARHCSPALAGIKPASLFSCPRAGFHNLEDTIRSYVLLLAERGIRLEILCHCQRSILLLVYRPHRLALQLAQPEVRQLLAEAGYPRGDVPTLLDHLRGRLAERTSFPHEIGLFLGYPPQDVVGFQEHDGRDFFFCGYWKVYSNPQEARRLFLRYDRCRQSICGRVDSGASIAQVFPAAQGRFSSLVQT